MNAENVLFLLTPEEFTIKDNWLGGIKVNGENQTGFDGLSDYLSEHFSLVEQNNLPKLLSNSSRSFLLSHQDISVWKLKDK